MAYSGGIPGRDTGHGAGVETGKVVWGEIREG